MEAAEQGGNLWHDNPAFEEVEQTQLILARAISEVKETLRSAIVVETSNEKLEDGSVKIGSIVKIKLGNSPPRIVCVGGSGESNPMEGLVSYLSPLGQALLGSHEQEEREYTAGEKTRKVLVLEITKKSE